MNYNRRDIVACMGKGYTQLLELREFFFCFRFPVDCSLPELVLRQFSTGFFFHHLVFGLSLLYDLGKFDTLVHAHFNDFANANGSQVGSKRDENLPLDAD